MTKKDREDVLESRRNIVEALAQIKKIRFDRVPDDMREEVWEKLLNASEYMVFAIGEIDQALKMEDK